MDLPPNVHVVRSKGRAYYYFQIGRNTKAPGPRTALGSDPRLPDFWRRLVEVAGTVTDKRTIRGLVRAYMGIPVSSPDGNVEYVDCSPKFAEHAPATKRDYAFYLDKIVDVWGDLPADAVRGMHVLAFRDTMKDSPGSANHMLSIGKTLFRWGVPREYATINPFREVEPLEVEDDGHWPWPDWALEHVAAHAWPDLARFVFLALHVGQRESDVVRLGPDALDKNGLWVRPQKTRKKKKAFWVGLISSALIEVQGWLDAPLVFDLERRRQPVRVGPGTAFVLSPTGRPYTTMGLRSRWNRWLRTKAGADLLVRWDEWERARRERDGDVVDPAAVLKPTLHGLRSTAVVHRRLAGYSDEQVSNDIGMSLPMVQRYSRFIDQRHAAETNIIALEEAQTRRKKA